MKWRHFVSLRKYRQGVDQLPFSVDELPKLLFILNLSWLMAVVTELQLTFENVKAQSLPNLKNM